MSGPFFSGYDAWKTREPDYWDDAHVCPDCGRPEDMARNTPYVVWVCEYCDEPEPPDEPDYDAWAKEQP